MTQINAQREDSVCGPLPAADEGGEGKERNGKESAKKTASERSFEEGPVMAR